MLDRLNPVLVKEVRQALRGRIFRLSLALTLVAASLATTVLVLAQPPEEAVERGVEYATTIYACLAVALMAIVPFSAFQSMGAEWEESTFDLLVLSDLPPRRIVIGKWLSSFVLALLFLSAFLPFFTFAFLLRGVDLLALAAVVVGTLLVSGVLSASAIAISSSTPQRFVRLIIVVALAAGLLSLVPAAVGIFYQVLTNAGILADPDAQIVFAWLGVAGLLSVAMSIAIACARLAHAEENRSSGLRLIGSLGIVAGLLATAHFYGRWGQPMIVLGMAVMIFLSLFGAGAWLCVEPLPLGRRVRKQVPRFPGLGLAIAPWLPGGTRGMLYVLLHAGAIFLVLHQILGSAPSTPSSTLRVGLNAQQIELVLFVVVLYGTLYLGVPLLFFGRNLARMNVRRMALGSIAAFAALASLGPSIYGLVVDDEALQEGQHLGMPGFLLERIGDHPDGLDALTRLNLQWLAFAAGFVLLLHLPRWGAALLEVQRAANARRAR
ncbi:MAG: hypothetical protein JNM84_25920 [Planctomycetes bacterium]|nr:hypothetical protein [Planctomycetota bacterium]